MRTDTIPRTNLEKPSNKVLVDFLSGDTVENLATVSDLTGVNRTELIRRGAEAAILISEIWQDSQVELRGALVESLNSLWRVLEGNPDSDELRRNLGRATGLALCGSAIFTVSKGREASEPIVLYAESLAQYQGALKASNYAPTDSQRDALKDDTQAFMNLLKKLDSHGQRDTKQKILATP